MYNAHAGLRACAISNTKIHFYTKNMSLLNKHTHIKTAYTI